MMPWALLGIKKEVAQKEEEKRPPANLKRTVNSCYKVRMMVEPLGIATVSFIDQRMSRPFKFVKDQALTQPQIIPHRCVRVEE